MSLYPRLDAENSFLPCPSPSLLLPSPRVRAPQAPKPPLQKLQPSLPRMEREEKPHLRSHPKLRPRQPNLRLPKVRARVVRLGCLTTMWRFALTTLESPGVRPDCLGIQPATGSKRSGSCRQAFKQVLNWPLSRGFLELREPHAKNEKFRGEQEFYGEKKGAEGGRKEARDYLRWVAGVIKPEWETFVSTWIGAVCGRA